MPKKKPSDRIDFYDLYPLLRPDNKPLKDNLGNPVYVKGMTDGQGNLIYKQESNTNEISKKHKKRK